MLHAGIPTLLLIGTLVWSMSVVVVVVVPTLQGMIDMQLHHPLGMTGNMTGMRRGALAMPAELLLLRGHQLTAMLAPAAALIGNMPAALDMVVPRDQDHMTGRLAEVHVTTEVHQHQLPHLSARSDVLDAAEAPSG